ncbi:hypothetical protein [Novosphingobium clariflavum]|uniref:Uncharacterized protein n=1 Tax=Novosphingobium clariflavum TaxID=2029884 RepID=A0ABV6SI29_9SPHN|nr:hypothetical protein [Novosphingobium clariflavum]
MTIRFSAARGGTTPVIMRALCPSAPLNAVNDNKLLRQSHRDRRLAPRVSNPPLGPALPSAANQNSHDERMLADALRHFATYGLAAASRARTNAETARLSGDMQTCNWWLAICRQLDRRMADALAQRIAHSS